MPPPDEAPGGSPSIPQRERFPPASTVRWKTTAATGIFPSHLFSVYLAGGANPCPLLILLVVIILLPVASSAQCIPIHHLSVNHGLKRHIIDVKEQRSMNLTLAYSDRVSQRLTTTILKIFLEEVIGYQDVMTVKIDDHTNSTTTLNYLKESENLARPVTMINADLWVPPGFADYDEDCGSQGTGARYGWYVRNFTERVPNFISDHWRSFLDMETTKFFKLTDDEEELVKEKFTSSPSGRYFCPKVHENRILCDRGIFKPPQCQKKNSQCATLFAGDFRYSSFLPSQIVEMKLLVQIAWIGPNLTPEFLYNFRGHRSILFFSWWPDNLSVLDGFMRVSFPFSTDMNSNYLYKYEFHSIRKKAWRNLENVGQLAYETLLRFSLEEKDYRHLLTTYNNRIAFNYSNSLVVSDRVDGWDDHIIEEIACDWLKDVAKATPSKLNTDWPATNYKKKTKLWIAGIFPVNDPAERYSSLELLWASTFAVDDINRNESILRDFELEIDIQNGGCDTHSVLYAFITYIKRSDSKQMVGILGPGCSSTVEPLAGLAKLLNIVLVSYSAEGAMLNDYDGYPYFFRTIPENKLYRWVYLELFKELGWQHIASLTEDGNNYSEYLTLLQNILQDENISIFNRKIARGDNQMASYLRDFKERNHRIIIGDFYSKMSRQLICEASKMGMTGKHGFVWFLPRWLPDDWYINKTDINCTTEDMLDALDGHLTLGYAYLAPDDYVYHQGETVASWKKRYAEEYKPPLDDYSGYTYDAVWTYAIALDRLMKDSFTHAADLHSDKTGELLVRFIQETNFRGVSGQIVFGDGPSRKPSTVNIMQFDSEEGIYHTVGHFYPESVKSGKLELNFSAFRWFTPNGQIPGDGSAPEHICALEGLMFFMGVTCEFAIIIAMLLVFVVFVFMLIFLFLCYRARLEKINHCRWRLADWMNLEEWEIPKERVVTNRVLGEGNFGTVYGGECMRHDDSQWDACAVKTLKPGSTIESKLDFLSEAEMMKRFNHQNIVKLIGLSTRHEPLYMIMEFMLYGNLKTYLLARRHLVSERTIFDDNNEISNRRLTSMALDVAKALEYLASDKYVHRDVACRNCLVSADRLIKLSDFGMTRQVYEESEYKFNRKGWLPLRWMAPESLEDGIFTTMTDMWSYGVLLYEIITFGNFPFQNMTDAQVLSHVKNGGTLSPPGGIRIELENLLYHCWRFNPNHRPSFTDMVEIFSSSPRLIMPCLEVPLASVESTEPDLSPDDTETTRYRNPPTKSGRGQSNNRTHSDFSTDSGYPSSRGCTLSITSNRSRQHHPVENGRGPVVEPLLSNNDAYVGRYACLQMNKSPDNSERDCPFFQNTSV